MLYNHQKQTFWNDGRSKCRPWKFFQRPSGYNMCHKLVQIDQNYQSHQMCVYFFRGSLEQSWSCILHCHCSSPLHVWFVQKLVRLIVLISPVKILNNMIHSKFFKRFLGDFTMACCPKIFIFAIFKAFISKIAYKNFRKYQKWEFSYDKPS